MEFWLEPIIRWRTGTDSVAHHGRLLAEGERLATWPPALFEDTATDCFRVGQEYWIWQPGVGGVRFLADHPEFDAFPSAQVDRRWFEYLINRSWLPAVYHLWGRQVLHASAVTRIANGEVMAFAGPSCAGKSTIAYGLSRRPGWSLVCDDTLAFSCREWQGRREILLHRLQNDARLRPASAAYYGKTGHVPESFEWPAGPLKLQRVYFLVGDENLPQPMAITRLPAAESYLRFLEQAHALTLEIPQHNQRLMTDYLEVASLIPAFRLAYRKSFDDIEQVLDAVENHLPAPVTPVLG